jgi:DNA modification methylase
MGSGSTLVAARALKRQVIGVELSPAHYETAVTRLLGPRTLVPVAA